jgi:agmatinase
VSFDPDAPASGDGLFGLPCTPEESLVHVLAVPWQATTSYRRGTRNGPARLVEASMQVDLHDLDVGAAWERGIALVEPELDVAALDDAAEPDALAVIEAGGGMPENAARVNALSEQVNAHVRAFAARTFAAGRVPAVIGGDHSVPFGAMQAAAERFPGLGVLHIDAHADLRDAYEGFTWSHASIMHNVVTRIPGVGRLVQVGIRDVGAAEVAMIHAHPARIRTFFDNAIARRLAEGEPWMAVVRDVVAALPEHVWVSFDVDGMDPSWCPATGTPVPGGLSFRDVVLLLGEVAKQRRVVGFDVNEIGDAEWDGNVAARLVYKLAGWVRAPGA